MASGLIIELGPPKKKSLASEIAQSIPPPSKLRKQKAMESADEDDGGDATLQAAFDAFADAVKSGDSKAGAKAFKLMSKLCYDDEEASEIEDDEDEE